MIGLESVMGIKPGDYGVVIWYQVDEFTYTGWWNILSLNHKFTHGLQARCQLYHTLQSRL